MSCRHCCGANELFDEKGARKDLKRYLKKGPKKPTKLLTEALKAIDLNNYSLLDIGGGIGSIPLELIPHGINRVTDVDASLGYIKVAKSEAENRNYDNLINYHLGDFVEENQHIQSHDIVTLDKVICCYPDVKNLLKTSLNKTISYYALVYPQSHWMSRFTVKLMNLKFKITGNPFRTFIHSPQFIDDTIVDAGFVKIHSEKTFFSWQMNLYKKIDIKYN